MKILFLNLDYIFISSEVIHHGPVDVSEQKMKINLPKDFLYIQNITKISFRNLSSN